ncbi:MAG: hypothetical protein ACO2PM_21075 [Pyrobaculum sp.]|jgi:hypothetical protein
MEPWLVCRVVLYAYRRRRAVAAVRTWLPLEAGRRAVLLLRGAGGEVFQVAGFVRRSAAGKGHYLVKVHIPWETALSLAAWAGKAVKEGAATALYSYAAKIGGMPLPPLKLVYDGYAALRGPFIYKVLEAPPGQHLLELLVGGVSLLIPLKYYKYERRGRRAGGGAGLFQLPLDALRTLRSWGLYDLDSDVVRLRVRVWALPPAAAWLITK